jgi:serine protease Do
MTLRSRRPSWRLGLAVAVAAATLAVSGLYSSATATPTPSPAGPPSAATVTPDGFADLIEAVKPAVVNISVKAAVTQARLDGPGIQPFGPGSPFEDFFRRFGQPMPHGAPPHGGPQMVQGSGSGFVIAADGYVVTNAHVVDGAEEVTVTLDDGTTHPAEVRGVDSKTDLAVLKIETDDALPYVEFGDSDAARVGDWVIAIGNPFGLGGTATTGIVSARGRDIQAGPFDDFLQIDAPINRGNSGGPLFDASGRVIGINTAIYSPNGGSVGIGFAIPASLAVGIVQQLKDDGRVERGWLGVSIQGMDEEIAESLGLEEPKGALVAEVVPDSPADEAGVRAGDVITAFDGDEVSKVKDLTRRAAGAEPGRSVGVTVWREGETVALTLEMGSSSQDSPEAEAPRVAAKGQLGLSLASLTDADRQRHGLADEVQGAVVASVAPNSPAARKGLRAGDVIAAVGQQPVASPDDVVREVARAREADRASVLLKVVRGTQSRYVALGLA